MKIRPEGLVSAVVIVGAIVLIGTLGPAGLVLAAALWAISKQLFEKKE